MFPFHVSDRLIWLAHRYSPLAMRHVCSVLSGFVARHLEFIDCCEDGIYLILGLEETSSLTRQMEVRHDGRRYPLAS